MHKELEDKDDSDASNPEPTEESKGDEAKRGVLPFYLYS